MDLNKSRLFNIKMEFFKFLDETFKDSGQDVYLKQSVLFQFINLIYLIESFTDYSIKDKQIAKSPDVVKA